MELSIQYERGMNHAYMWIPKEMPVDNYRQRMTERGKLPGWISPKRKTVGELTGYEYEISGKISLKEYREHHDLSEEFYREWALQLGKGLELLEEYFLSEEDMLLTEETIFVEEISHGWKIEFCLYPNEGRRKKEDFKKIIKLFMQKGQESMLLYELYERTLKENFTLKEVKEVLENLAIKEAKEREREKKSSPFPGFLKLYSRKEN